MEIKIGFEPGFQGKLQRLIDLRAARMFAANSVVNFLRAYHAEFAERWRGTHWMAGGDSGAFAAKVVAGWKDAHLEGNDIVLENTFGLLDWKVSGGTITPKTAQYLTIPLVPEAKGVSARSFGKLFKAGNALCEKIGNSVRAIYALKRSVTQAPWPNAMPPNSVLDSLYEQVLDQEIQRIADS